MFLMNPVDDLDLCEAVAEERMMAELGLRTLPDWLTAIYEHIEEWRRAVLEPHKLVPPGGYHSPRCIAAGLDAILRINELKTEAERVPTEITAQAVAYRVVNQRVPVYYIAEDFCRAVAATDLPHDFTFADLHWPMPAMVLGFPANFLRECVGKESCYVFVARFAKGEHSCPFFPAAPTVVMPQAKIALFWYACPTGRLESFVSSFWEHDRLDEAVLKHGYTDYTNGDAVKVQADKECCNRLSVLVFKLLVVLNTRPNLVEPATRLRTACAHKGKTKRELWSANIIGRVYRVIRDRTAPTGAHCSPRLHWRRGHLRNQPHGQGRALRKLVWIEPMLIGMGEPAKSFGSPVTVINS
jgi:hypothetical protein